ncbi:MAG: hypothetical protein WD810_07520 [Solirubrobacterales bacterium]
MAAVREAWTDERLDDLSQRMDRGFDRLDTDIREVRTEMNTRFDVMDARMDGMQRTIIVGFVSVLASVIATQL